MSSGLQLRQSFLECQSIVLRATFLFGVAASAFATPLAKAGLFDDEEARKAILELRQRVEANRVAAETSQQRMAERQAAQLEELAKRMTDEAKRNADDLQASKRGNLELANQIEALRTELNRQRGLNEQMTRDLAEVQRRQKDGLQAFEERLRKLEPQKVTVDGRDFFVDVSEKREFDAALASFRRGEFAPAAQSFADFLRRYPGSGYASSSLFWLANAQFATKEFKESVSNFREMLRRTPEHPRAAEALLGIGNGLLEQKDTRGARAAYQELITAHPQSEAAASAKDRVSKLR